jgi:hypothetical protein
MLRIPVLLLMSAQATAACGDNMSSAKVPNSLCGGMTLQQMARGQCCGAHDIPLRYGIECAFNSPLRVPN